MRTLRSSQIFVVLKLSRGASDVIAAFTEQSHADKFIDKIKAPGTYKTTEVTLFKFDPDEFVVSK